MPHYVPKEEEIKDCAVSSKIVATVLEDEASVNLTNFVDYFLCVKMIYNTTFVRYALYFNDKLVYLCMYDVLHFLLYDTLMDSWNVCRNVCMYLTSVDNSEL